MKLTTNVAYRFESLGHPTKTLEGPPKPLGSVIRELVTFLTQTPMGSRFELTLARSIPELSRPKAARKSLDIFSDLGLDDILNFDQAEESGQECGADNHADVPSHERSEAVLTQCETNQTHMASETNQTQPEPKDPAEPIDSESPSKIFNLKRLGSFSTSAGSMPATI